jgi:hypothetical protein
MNERILSKLQKEYRLFFLEKLNLYGVKSPAELTKEGKSKFFTEIKQEWSEIKISKKKVQETQKKPGQAKQTPTTKTTTERQIHTPKEKIANKEVGEIQEPLRDNQEFSKQIIKSEPNKDQTDDLKILFNPLNHFAQEEKYLYPVVKMPKQNSVLKLPRLHRSNQKGYKENDFFDEIKLEIIDLEITNNVHMVIPNYSKPYEPDIVLFDKKLNLYIDVEIDEPYDGFYRYPTHNYRAEDDFKQDDIRDLFFTESGWVVIRFTEKQVHKQPKECIDYIQNVIDSIYNKEFDKTPKCEVEHQWNENQCIQWQLNNYREIYLEIPAFDKRTSHKEVFVAEREHETIETKIHRTRFEEIEKQYDKDLHKYFHPNDKTGNAEYLSVTTLVERIFQFDILRYIQREAEKQNKDEEELFREFQILRDEAAVLGTELHLQIENYFTKKPFNDSLQEFKYFLNFEKEKIIPKGLIFSEAEKKIFNHKYNVAGTVDCLFKNSEGKYVMVDWKRSKKLIVKGTDRPDKRGFQIEIEGLNTLTNCSYYRYCIQQNMYKYILEKEYNITISEMILTVLHENYPNYHTIKLPEMIKEIKTILNSINHKI